MKLIKHYGDVADVKKDDEIIIDIDRDTLLELGITAQEAIDHLESTRAIHMTPARVRALYLLKQSAIISNLCLGGFGVALTSYRLLLLPLSA